MKILYKHWKKENCDILLFFISESWGFWRFRTMQVRVEDIKTIEAHLRMSHSSISRIAVGQVRVVMQPSWRWSPLSKMGVAAGWTPIAIIRAIAWRWRRVCRLLFLGPTTSCRHDRQLTFYTLCCWLSLSNRRISFRAIHFETLFSSLRISQSLSVLKRDHRATKD